MRREHNNVNQKKKQKELRQFQKYPPSSKKNPEKQIRANKNPPYLAPPNIRPWGFIFGNFPQIIYHCSTPSWNWTGHELSRIWGDFHKF